MRALADPSSCISLASATNNSSRFFHIGLPIRRKLFLNRHSPTLCVPFLFHAPPVCQLLGVLSRTFALRNSPHVFEYTPPAPTLFLLVVWFRPAVVPTSALTVGWHHP